MIKQPYVIKNVMMQRDQDQLLINLNKFQNQELRLLMGSKPTLTAINQQVAKSEQGKFKISLPVNQLPQYFVIEGEYFRTNIFSERVLPLTHAINVRDLGGYETNDGRFTKWGLLFRGDQLTNIDQDEVALLERYGLKTLVDYRSAHERKVHPNQTLGTVLTIYNCDPHSSFSQAAADVVDLQGENKKLVQALKNGEVDPKFINDRGDNVVLSYQELVTSVLAQKAYGRFLHACADPEQVPIFHHCRGGKDRTGFGSMLLLLLLNVKDEEIVKDYMLTKPIREQRNQLKYNLYRQLVDKKEYLDYLMAMIDTREKYVRAALTKIRESYGTPEQYFIQHFHFTAAGIEQIRDFYLEKGVQLDE